MTEPLPEFDGTQRRIRQQRALIHTEFGTISLGRNQTTMISETGDIITDDSIHLISIDGQVVYDPSQIIGHCQNPECRKLLTARTFGYCALCFQVRCPDCSAFDEIIGNWLCTECYAAVKRKRFWEKVRRLIAHPFRRY